MSEPEPDEEIQILLSAEEIAPEVEEYLDALLCDLADRLSEMNVRLGYSELRVQMQTVRGHWVDF